MSGSCRPDTGFAQATGWGAAGMLRQALDRVWAAIEGDQAISAEQARELVERCLQQVPHLDDPFDTDLAAPAQNAAIAVLQTVECARDGDPRNGPKVSATSPLTRTSLLHKGLMVVPWFGRSVRNVAETQAGHTGLIRDAGRVAVVCCMHQGRWR